VKASLNKLQVNTLKSDSVRFQVLTAANMKMTAFWDNSFLEYSAMCSRWFTSARLHGAISTRTDKLIGFVCLAYCDVYLLQEDMSCCKHKLSVKLSHFTYQVQEVRKYYVCWSVTLRKEHSLRVFENGVLRRIFGPKRDEVTGE
jgi:hypothetical protein